MPHLSVMVFPRKEPFLAMGPEALSYLRAQWEWGQVIHTLDFFFFKLGPLSMSVSLSDGLSLALTSFPACQNDLHSFAESLADVS